MFLWEYGIYEIFQKIWSRIKNKVNLFIPDPPYNVLQNGRDKFTTIDISNLCKYAVNFLDPKGTIIIFCSNLQYRIYVEELI